MVEQWNPSTLKEVLQIKKQYKDAVIYAGGSDLMVAKKQVGPILFINQVPQLKEIREQESMISIGAAAVYCELLNHPLIPALLKMVMKEIASPAIRNTATMGGNICNASPAGDTLPILYLYNAKLVVASLGDKDEIKERMIPIEDFILGVRKIDLRPEEILTYILIPKNHTNTTGKIGYKKVGARKAQAISKVLFTAIMSIEDDVITDLRVAYGSVGPTVIRKKDIEARYIGLEQKELKNKIPEIIEAYNEWIHPIDDQRSTAVYRKKVCLNLLKDFLYS